MKCLVCGVEANFTVCERHTNPRYVYRDLMAKSTKPEVANDFCNQRLFVKDRAFTEKECEEALRSFDRYPRERGLVGKPAVDGDPSSEYSQVIDKMLRDCYVTYVARDSENAWLHERLEAIMAEANDKYWQLHITDYSQPMRLMSYYEGDHFNSLHSDHGVGDTCFRKLTCILQVSKPTDYVGGQFEVIGEPTPPEAYNQGSVLVFPTYLIHRVSPVTSGIRHSVIHRAIGPWFR